MKKPPIPTLAPSHIANRVRYFAHIVEKNRIYYPKLVITAMPNDTDECPKIIGTLTVTAVPHAGHDTTPVEWIEVDSDYRRKGIAREMWRLAERLLGWKLEHAPVTPEGEKFADAMESKSAIAASNSKGGAA